MTKLMLSIFFVLAAGCASDTPRANLLIKQSTLEVMPIKQELLAPCDVVIPPSVTVYMAGSKDEREDLLSRYAIDSISSIRRCSSDKSTIGTINQHQAEQIKQFNQSEVARVNQLKQSIQEGKDREPNKGN